MLLFRTLLVAIVGLVCVEPAWAERPDEKSKVKVEFRRAETKAGEGLVEATIEGSKEKVYLHETADLTGVDVDSARVIEDTPRKPAIEISLTKAGGTKMAKLSEEHKDKPLAIIVDGKVISAPRLLGKLADKAWITGSFTKEEAERIAKTINGK